MNDYELTNQIKQLKRITPPPHLGVRLRSELVNLTRPQPVSALSLLLSKRFTVPAVGLMMIAIFALSNLSTNAPAPQGPTVSSNQPARLAGLNNEEIIDEMNVSNDINISLSEVAYHDTAGQKINMALNEISQPGRPY